MYLLEFVSHPVTRVTFSHSQNNPLLLNTDTDLDINSAVSTSAWSVKLVLIGVVKYIIHFLLNKNINMEH